MSTAATHSEILDQIDEKLAALSPDDQFAVIDVLISDLCHKAETLEENFAAQNEEGWRAPRAISAGRIPIGHAPAFTEEPTP